jgi:hypothetical protein
MALPQPNYTSSNISRQIATQSGGVALSTNQGSLEWRDTLTGQTIQSQPADSSLLSVSPSSKINLSSKNIDKAAGVYATPGVPQALVNMVATTAAYAVKTTGAAITDLVTPNGVSIQFLGVYNQLAQPGSQIGIVTEKSTKSAWTNNPTLRGSISAAGSQP